MLVVSPNNARIRGHQQGSINTLVSPLAVVHTPGRQRASAFAAGLAGEGEPGGLCAAGTGEMIDAFGPDNQVGPLRQGALTQRYLQAEVGVFSVLLAFFVNVDVGLYDGQT